MAGQRTGNLLCLLTTGALLALVAMALLAVSFGTDHWQDIDVDRDALKVLAESNNDLNNSLYLDYTYFDRHRGIFRICVPGDETLFLQSSSSGLTIVDGNCIWDEGMYLPAERSWGQNNNIREHLLRSHMALFALALLLLLVTTMLAGFACWNVASSYMIGAGIAALVAAFSAVGGMAVFHGYLHLEINQITDGMIFAAYWDEVEPLASHSSWAYGLSYILGWVGSIVAIFSSLFFLSAGFSIRRQQQEEKEPLAYVEPAMMKPAMPPPMFAPQPQVMPVMSPPRVVRVPTPVPYPVPVAKPVPVPVPMHYPTMPRQQVVSSLPMLTYPTLAAPQARSTRSAFDRAVYQSQPPAYPSGNANFSSAHSALM